MKGLIFILTNRKIIVSREGERKKTEKEKGRIDINISIVRSKLDILSWEEECIYFCLNGCFMYACSLIFQ